MTDSLIIWLICDGKPGHENQSLGLSDAISRIMPSEVHRISLNGIRGLFARLKATLKASLDLPRPDLIIAAGHATHPSLLRLARRYQSRSIVIMRPSFPMSWFDLCISPDHDFPNGSKRENLILTRGALNRVIPPKDEKREGKMILIGGPSASHGWDGPELISALGEICIQDSWELADSRRTPEGFQGDLRKALPSVTIHPHQQTTPDWLPRKLAAADEVWVTEDSVSMVHEALSSGAKVGLLPVPRLGESSRVLRGIDGLISGGYLTPFQRWKEDRHLAAPPETLREADRCARIVLERLFRNGS